MLIYFLEPSLDEMPRHLLLAFFLNFQMSDIFTDIILYLKIHSYAK